jgi:AraC family transcriptional regulator of adaptative response/methylated-DNA-[protein]-cysteine methyltransferase
MATAIETGRVFEAVRTEHDPRCAAVVARERRADGSFYYSVKTTGIYCRPSCPSRVPHPKNVRFHHTIADAERAGFRPCKRCKPGSPPLEQLHAATIADVCAMIERAEEPPSLMTMASRASLSPYHFHRVFKAVTGVTPKAYATAHRASRVREGLRGTSKTVTEAVYEAGFGSSGRFYSSADHLLGMTPKNFRSGGTQTRIRIDVGECSLGSILVAQSPKGVCAILFGDDPDVLTHDVQDWFPGADFVVGDMAFEQTVAKVVGFVENPQLGLDLPLHVRGTAFQHRVWKALCQIPVGSTASYEDIALLVGAPKGARAVAGACAANRLAVAIPCHRVVRTDGSLSGYRWGVERKGALLAREGAA